MATAGRAQPRGQQQSQQPQLLQAAMQALQQPDIRQKLLFTFAMVVIFRFVSNVPVPGVNTDALEALFESEHCSRVPEHLLAAARSPT